MTKECYVLAYVHRTKSSERVHRYLKISPDCQKQSDFGITQSAIEEAVIAGVITRNEAKTAHVDIVQDGSF